MTSSVLALSFGIFLGPRILGLVQVIPGGWEDGEETDQSQFVLLWLTRIVICLQVLSTGVTLPEGYLLRKNVRQTLLILLGPAMTVKVILVGMFTKLIFGIGWLESFLIGACLAPTDPVLASGVVKGTFAEQHVPPYIRHLILCESGINDGSATPFFLFFLYFLNKTGTAGQVWKDFFLHALLWETLFPIVLGGSIGWLARTALAIGKKRDWVDKESSLVFTVALALLVTGFSKFLDTNEILACFCAGAVLGGDGTFRTEELHTHFSEGIDNLLDISVFFTLGTVLPWHAWLERNEVFPIGKLAGFSVLVLLFRRMPIVLALSPIMPVVKTPKEASFVGWFGPMGVGAIYYALRAGEDLPDDNILKQNLYSIISWVVMASTIVHGVTLPTFLLASSIHPIFHPKMLVQSAQDARNETYEEDQDEDEEAGEGDELESPETTERTWLLGPMIHLAQRYGRSREEVADGDIDSSEGPSTNRRQRNPNDPDEGMPISRAQLHRIMNKIQGDQVEMEGSKILREGKSTLNQRQKEALLGDGTGLTKWDLEKDISVYDEGNMLIITDEAGNVSTRPIFKQRKRLRRAETYS